LDLLVVCSALEQFQDLFDSQDARILLLVMHEFLETLASVGEIQVPDFL
jgi:hypothetical protein